MNRPRNRQPRGRQNTQPRPHHFPSTPQQASGTVPTISQLTPGTPVYIILKEDQPTGKETHGIVSELLTKGNHPRGIKVRLRDGQVGRVQRLSTETSAPAKDNIYPNSNANAAPARTGRFSHKYTDIRQDEYHEEPPPRSLADFLPPSLDQAEEERQDTTGGGGGGQPALDCPFCADFKGDETAVTVHIEREHLG